MLPFIKNQPPAFRMIFMLEIWERFGFYTAQGILTLYLIRFLGYNDTQAYYCFGAFSALVYGLVAIGGYLGDSILGSKRTIVLGLITLSIGYFCLAITDQSHVFYALAIICVGSGLFKANPSSLLSKCYAPNDPRLHSGFTLYYMAINLGSIFSLFIGPTLASHYGYGYAYSASSIGLILGLVNYWYQRNLVKDIHTQADERHVPLWQWGLILLAIVAVIFIAANLLQNISLARNILSIIIGIVIAIYIIRTRREPKAMATRMRVALVLMIEAIIFFVLYQQMPTSLTLYAVHNVTASLFGIPINPQSFQALNPIWIITLSPFIAALYTKLNQKGIKLTVPYKFAAGMLSCGVSFSILFFSGYFHNSAGMVSSGWLICSYFFQSLGELLVSALGVAMVAELVPVSMTGFVMGMWFLTSSIAGFLGASVGSLAALPVGLVPGVDSLVIYTHVFGKIGGVTLLIGILMLIFAKYLNAILEKN